MDYLQTLELRMGALQRKIRLLQDLRFFVDTSTPEELSAFGQELRSVMSSSGVPLGEVFEKMLAAPGTKAPASSGTRPSLATPAPDAASASAPPTDTAPRLAGDLPTQAAQAPAATAGDAEAAAEALAQIDPSMKPIPAGSFVMGSETVDAEKPPHKVSLHAFRLCDHLATNKEYSLFIEANPAWAKDRADPELRDGDYLSEWGDSGYPEGKDEHPVSFVSFYAAKAFAAWLGKRLPTEAEWECAARGGLVGKKFPSGDQMNDKLANLAKQFKGTTPAGKFEPNGFGLYDMAGNLFEWTADWYGPYSSGEARDPEGPPDGEYKVVRGGSWMSGAGALRVSNRVDMEPQSCGQVGIRLADNCV
jgi:formylglycine-generating enzyme required for sulfatase activity